MSNIGLYGRSCSLQIMSVKGQPALDLSEFRIVFHVEAQDWQYPGTAVIRVYNLNDDTVNQITSEYQSIVLQAGYETGPFGAIFIGQIRQFKKGKEDAVTTYLDFLCSDSDAFHNAAPLSQVLGSGWTPLQAISEALNNGNRTQQDLPNPPDVIRSNLDTNQFIEHTGVAIRGARGKVLFGLNDRVIQSSAASLNCSWHIRNGVLNVIPFTGYLPSQTVVLSTLSGVVGIPEVTNEGIKIKCLLNPLIQLAGTISLDNKLVNQILNALGNQAANMLFSKGVAYNAGRTETGIQYFANVGLDGAVYKVVVLEYEGDTRGGPWYVNITALLADKSSSTVNVDPTGLSGAQ